jgi:xylulokinase
MAAVGAGVIEPELACYSMGTAEVISTCFDEPLHWPAMLESHYPWYCHAVADKYFTVTLNQSGGLSLGWFGDVTRSEFAELHEGVSLCPSQVMFLPHIVGSGTPTCDHLSRGSFLGLSLATGRAEMFQAVVDALAFEARVNLDSLARLDLPITELRAVGGGSRSEKILELKATVVGRPIRTLKNPEAALLGGAILAQVAIGQFADVQAACAECVKVERTIEPRADAAEAYAAAYDRYRQLYGALRPFYHNWRPECRATALA